MSSSNDTPSWPSQGQPVPPPPPPPPPPVGSQGGQGGQGWYGPQYWPGGQSPSQGWTIPAGYQGEQPGAPGAPGWTGGQYPVGGQDFVGGESWTGSGWPGAPVPGAPGVPGGQHGHRARRLRRSLVVAVVAAAVGAASTFLGLHHPAGSSGSAVLTTAEVASKVDPALVDINTTLGYQHEEAAGTGLVLTSSGEVLTNNHVIEGSTSITATDIGNGRTYRAVVVGYDRSHDIAVIKLQNASGLSTVTLGSSSTAQLGQKVVAIGNAEGRGGRPSVVTGQILALGASITASDQSAGTAEKLTGLIRHDAPIQPGDSGGPLANTSGEVIGIDTAASSGDFQIEGQTGQSGQTQGFAIPINTAISIANQISAGKGSTDVHLGATGFVGVEVSSAQQAESEGVPANAGALVAGLISGSPAQEAGLGVGDLITSVDSEHVSSPTDLQHVLEGHHPGDKVVIGWASSNGGKHTATMTLTSGPAG